jgi:hypothetical protein
LNTYLKAIILAVYILAAIGSLVMLPAGVTSALQMVALVLLAAHTLELLFAINSVKRYSGPLVDSIALTLLFGILHWKRLGKAL